MVRIGQKHRAVYMSHIFWQRRVHCKGKQNEQLYVRDAPRCCVVCTCCSVVFQPTVSISYRIVSSGMITDER